jgi:hypothetical protein
MDESQSKLWALNALHKLIELVIAAEKAGELPGKDKKDKVLAEYQAFLETLPGEIKDIPAFLTDSEKIGWLIDRAIILGKIVEGKATWAELILGR